VDYAQFFRKTFYTRSSPAYGAVGGATIISPFLQGTRNVIETLIYTIDLFLRR